MTNNNTKHLDSGSPIGDTAFLSRAQHRIPALVALTERPRSRSELCELAGVSSSTIRWTLDAVEDIGEDRVLSSNQETTPIQHDECAVTCLDSVTTGSGDGCWTRWSP